MLKVDPATGKATVLFTEKARARSWINLSDDYRPLHDGSLIWWSERDGYRPSLSLRQRQVDAADQGRLGGHRTWSASTRRKGRSIFIGNKDDVLEQQLYSVDIAQPGRDHPADRARLVEQRDDGQGGARALHRHPLEPEPADADLSRRHGGQAPRLGQRECGRRRAIPIPLSRQPSRADVRHDQGRRRHRRSTTR